MPCRFCPDRRLPAGFAKARAAFLAAFLSLVVAVATLPATAAAGDAVSAKVFDAIVQIRATVPPDARSAANLGTQREGSGVLIDDDGLILTIGYIVLESVSIEVDAVSGRTSPATLVAYDHDTGFGLIRATASLGVRPMEMGSSDGLAERTPVLAASFGGPSQALGAFVVDRRDFAGYWEYLLDNAVFTSPPHPRFGGAALIDENGRLVGIGSLIVPDAAQIDENRVIPGNMFIPIDALKPIMGDLIASGRSSAKRRPWLGLYSQEIQGRLFVARVAENSPAWKAGVRRGDLVIGVDGKPVDGLADFYRKIWALGEPGTKVPLMVLRGNEPREVTVHSIDRYDWLKLRPSY